MGLDMYLYKVPQVEDSIKKDIQIRLSKAVAFGDWKKEKRKIDQDLGFELPIKEYSFIDKTKYAERVKEEPDNEELLIEWSPISVGEEVGYWRKFNALHNWFVQNVQDGEDDCGEYEITPAGLEQLEMTLEMVLDPKNKDMEAQQKLLPTKSGFFFGGTDYDSYYFNEAKETLELVKKLRKETDFDKYKFIYSSSW